jgi:hypothetical protein
LPLSRLSITASSRALRFISLASRISTSLRSDGMQPRPAAVLEGVARLFDGEIHVFGPAGRDLGDHRPVAGFTLSKVLPDFAGGRRRR